MNYANAVKRPKTRAYLANFVQSQAELEFGVEASKEVVSRLLLSFKEEYIYEAVGKVYFY